MDAKDLTEALRWLCRLIDEGRPRGTVPQVLLRCALPAALGLAGCGGGQDHPTRSADNPVEVVDSDGPEEPTRAGGDAVELVRDGADNDGDGLVDCADPDCAALAACLAEGKEDVPMYGVPFERGRLIPCLRSPDE